eukprot:1208380-Pyramimonas_sp.AAC.1
MGAPLPRPPWLLLGPGCPQAAPLDSAAARANTVGTEARSVRAPPAQKRAAPDPQIQAHVDFA